MKPEPDPARGGVLRVFLHDEAESERIWRPAVARPLVGERGLAATSQATASDVADEPACLRIRFDHAPRLPDGRSVHPGEIVEAWRRGLTDPDLPHRWLLEPLLRDDSSEPEIAVGPGTDENTLELCPRREAPDLAQRLSHPALWYWRPALAVREPEGPGPFAPSAGATLRRNPYYDGPAPFLDELRRVGPDEEMTLLMRVGEADLGVSYGKAESTLRGDLGDGFRLERLERWDRTYCLWLDPQDRWINDPRLRRWLAGRIDRAAMVRYLFDGAGEQAWALVPTADGRDGGAANDDRPLSPGSRPRLRLAFDRQDRLATEIAQRLQAEMGADGVDLQLDARSSAEVARLVRSGEAQMALITHRPALEDPVLGLMETVAGLGTSGEGAWEILRQASRLPDPEFRARAARAADAALVDQAVLIPIVRLHATLVTDARLLGVVPGTAGTLLLDQAGWVP